MQLTGAADWGAVGGDEKSERVEEEVASGGASGLSDWLGTWYSKCDLVLWQCFSPCEEAVFPRMGKKIWIAFDEFDSPFSAADFKYPKSAYKWTIMFVSQATGHWDLRPIDFEIG
jgi:hypothetical protein